jgi:hypothetical protein
MILEAKSMIYQSILDTTPHISTAGMEYEVWQKKCMDSLIEKKARG